MRALRNLAWWAILVAGSAAYWCPIPYVQNVGGFIVLANAVLLAICVFGFFVIKPEEYPYMPKAPVSSFIGWAGLLATVVLLSAAERWWPAGLILAGWIAQMAMTRKARELRGEA